MPLPLKASHPRGVFCEWVVKWCFPTGFLMRCDYSTAPHPASFRTIPSGGGGGLVGSWVWDWPEVRWGGWVAQNLRTTVAVGGGGAGWLIQFPPPTVVGEGRGGGWLDATSVIHLEKSSTPSERKGSAQQPDFFWQPSVFFSTSGDGVKFFTQLGSNLHFFSAPGPHRRHDFIWIDQKIDIDADLWVTNRPRCQIFKFVIS